MKSFKQKARGPCLWPGCKWPGTFFTGRTVGFEVLRGYWCDLHDRMVAKENLERLTEGPRFVPGPVQWSEKG